MARIIGLILVVFVAAFVLGFSTPAVDAASCYYKCSCEGTPLRCCIVNGVEFCKVTSVIQCPQVYEC